MPETLLTPSSIKLFGRVVSSLSYVDDTHESRIGCNNFLQDQLSCKKTILITGSIPEIIEGGRPPIISDTIIDVKPIDHKQRMDLISPGMLVGDNADHFAPNGNTIITTVDYKSKDDKTVERITVFPRPIKPGSNLPITISIIPLFARIYTFSYEGAIYPLPRPGLFLVHGPGIPVDVTGNSRGRRFPSVANLGRTTLDESGVFAREWEFSAPQSDGDYDLRYWEYEKGDFSIRFDMEAGQLEQILLMAALRAGADRSGMQLSGMQLSGMQLSGMQLSGMQLGGNPNSRNGR